MKLGGLHKKKSAKRAVTPVLIHSPCENGVMLGGFEPSVTFHLKVEVELLADHYLVLVMLTKH